MKQLPVDAREELDRPIAPSELEEEIKDLKNNKSPGPDSYVNEFYKPFKDILSPLLLKAYNCVLEKNMLAPS